MKLWSRRHRPKQPLAGKPWLWQHRPREPQRGGRHSTRAARGEGGAASEQNAVGSMVDGEGATAKVDLFMRQHPNHEVRNGVGRFVGSDSKLYVRMIASPQQQSIVTNNSSPPSYSTRSNINRVAVAVNVQRVSSPRQQPSPPPQPEIWLQYQQRRQRYRIAITTAACFRCRRFVCY